MEIYKEYDSLYILERNHKKLIIFLFMAIFVSNCPRFWGPGVIYKAHDTQYMFESPDQKLIVFVLMAVFVIYCPQFLRFRGDLQSP
jgi:F0F1-type ATP synthase membrane subunit a